MDVSVSLSANAGIAIELAGIRILIDAFPEGGISGYSCIDHSMLAKILNNDHFNKPDVIITTHSHKDHYSEEFNSIALTNWADAIVIGAGEECRIDLNNIIIRTVELPHEGRRYSNFENTGVIITALGKTILIPSDCAVAAEELSKLIENNTIDLAILDFPWITLRRGRNYIFELMKPKSILLYHIPFEADDIYGYRDAVYDALNLTNDLDIRVLSEFLQTEDFKL